MASEPTARHAIRTPSGTVNTGGGSVLGKVPDEEGLVPGGGNDHVGVVDGGSNGCDHVRVTAHRASEDHGVCHLAVSGEERRRRQMEQREQSTEKGGK